jgi:type 1 fimbriae regulatory protein FimB
MNHLDKCDMIKLLRTAKLAGPREHAMCLLGYIHGMRAEEICGLRLEDLDLAAETVVVRRLKGSKTAQKLPHSSSTPQAEFLADRSGSW